MQETTYFPETRDEKLRRLDYYIKDGESNRDQFINDNLPTLLRRIQSKYTLLPRLVSKRVIDQIEMEDIQSERTEYRQNEQLIKVIGKISKESYLTFLEVLAEKQEDLVQLLTGGEWKKKPASKAASSQLRPDKTGLDFTIKDRAIPRDQWRNCLSINRRELVDSIQVDSLLDGCLSNDILSDREVAAVKVEKSVYDRAGKLCDILLRIDSAYYIPFLRLLHECQPSIAKDLAQSLDVL